MLGHPVPASLKEYLSLTTLKESHGHHTGNQMLQALLHDHESVITTLHAGIALANSQQDDGTADLLIQRLRSHEKMAWFLRSHFK